MSHRALQAALVLAQHDPAFIDALHADPDATLGPLGLDAAERRALVAVDPRAFRLDPLRRRRTLRVLAEEYRVATTLALAETGRLAFAEGFFGSRHFRRAVVGRVPLALQFGEWLLDAGLGTPQLGDILRLELAVARCRREAGQPPAPGIGLTPGVRVIQLFGGALEAVQRVERWLFEIGLMPQVALCNDAPPLPELPAVGDGPPLYLLLQPSANGVALTPIDAELHGGLAALARPVARADLARTLAPAGVPSARTESVVRALLDDGLLSEGAAAAPAAPELFYELATPDCATARRMVLATGLTEVVTFRNVHYDRARSDHAARGGSTLPALWDGELLHQGLADVLAALARLAPARER